MVLRIDAVQARLRRLEEVLSELEALSRLDRVALRASLRDRWAVERGLQLGAEILFDIGNHILVAQYGVSPQDHEDVAEQLFQQGILDEELRARLKGLGGFRNLLVHDYLRLEPDKVAEALDRAPRDFGDFARAIRQWLDFGTPP